MHMKRLWPFVGALAILLAGCTPRYVITLHGGDQISTRGKPKREGGYFLFTDIRGQSGSVPVSRVREVAPASMASKPESSGD